MGYLGRNVCLPNSHDIVAKIEAPDMETIKRVISEKIRALKAIKTTTTMIAQISA